MEVVKNVHRIRIDFQVTKKAQRFVYVYLIMGTSCYLIDSGVAGSEKIIGEYMQRFGRDLNEIKAIFLTHAHPDHIGSAAAVKERSDCNIYCSREAKNWIEDIDLQFQERPIPNFYRLAGCSVPADRIVQDKEKICPEDGIKIEVLDTAGHSRGDVSYLLNDRVLFSGDAIPTAEDFPILVDIEKSIQTLDNIKECGFEKCCPAWDRVYERNACMDILQNRKEMLIRFKREVAMADKRKLTEEEKIWSVAKGMGWKNAIGNPLFTVSVEACRKKC